MSFDEPFVVMAMAFIYRGAVGCLWQGLDEFGGLEAAGVVVAEVSIYR